MMVAMNLGLPKPFEKILVANRGEVSCNALDFAVQAAYLSWLVLTQ